MLENPNIILAGFMATGKTSVGEEIARLTGLEFIDTDRVLEARFDLSIPEIFAEHGEERFREEEKKLAIDLSTRRNTVIATGGGMIVDDGSRRAFEGSGEIFCLSATTETITARLGKPPHRPLIEAGDRTRRITELLASRRGTYLTIDNQVSTDGLTPVETAVEIIGRLGPNVRRTSVETPAGISYSILVGRGIVEELPELLARAGKARRVFVITDSNVHSIHSWRLAEILSAAGYNPDWFVFPRGESSKSLETAAGIYSFLADRSAQKDSCLIAFGGGVVGDVAGFAASTYMRGVSLVHIPTTLMAQGDSSIGSKNAVNRPEAKNLVGTFYHPEMVLADPEYLLTLPEREFRSGFAEVVKTAIIEGESAFRALEILSDVLERRELSFLETVIFRCIRKKAGIVSRDMYEKNERRFLNLGHTFGHAVEKGYGYTGISHGEAVALGIRTAAAVSQRLGKLAAPEAERIVDLLNRTTLLGTSREEAETIAGLLQTMVLDKKARGGKLTIVLPRSIGDIEIMEDIEPGELGILLEELREETIREEGLDEEDTRHARPEPEGTGKKGA